MNCGEKDDIDGASLRIPSHRLCEMRDGRRDCQRRACLMMEASTLAQPQPTQSEATERAVPSRLYDSFGMNPRIVRFYLAEKGIDIPRHEVDILGAENRGADYLKINPAGQLPTL